MSLYPKEALDVLRAQRKGGSNPGWKFREGFWEEVTLKVFGLGVGSIPS